METVGALVVEGELKRVHEALDRFDIPKERSISLLHGGFNSNWYVETKNGAYVIKRRSKEERLKSQKEVLLQGLLWGRIHTAKPVFALGNRTIDVVDGEWCYTVFEFIDGRKYDGSNEADFSSVIGSLAQLHAKTSDFLSLIRGVRDINWTSMEWAKHYIDLCELGNVVVPAVADRARKYIEEARWSIEMIKKGGDEVRSLPESLVHWDYHGGNIRIRDGSVYIFDLEFAHMESRIADVANSAIIFAALDESKLRYDDAATFIQPCALNMPVFDRFLRAYANHAESQLTREEAATLPYYLQIAWLGWCFYTFYKMPASRTAVGYTFDFVDWVRSHADIIVSHAQEASR